jgi:uncharacterized SAM-dependent methyltransferase
MIDIQQSAHAYSTQQDIVQTEEDRVLSFREDVLAGLKSHPKHLSSKYFYDAKGDALFQQIMNCSEYYLTRC